MLVLHIALYCLIGACLVFSIVELGLSAYVASVWSGTRSVGYYDLYQGYVYNNVHVSTPGILDFLIFSAVWSMLASAAALVLPWFYTRKGLVSATLNTVLGVTFAIVYFVTWVFWLACFADIESMLGGAISSNDYLNAVIAFAILLWYASRPGKMNVPTNSGILVGSSSSPCSSSPSWRFPVWSSPTGWAISRCARLAQSTRPRRLGKPVLLLMMCLLVRSLLLPRQSCRLVMLRP